VFQDKASEMADCPHYSTSKNIFEADCLPNPFEFTTWHREALLLANTVVSREFKNIGMHEQ